MHPGAIFFFLISSIFFQKKTKECVFSISLRNWLCSPRMGPGGLWLWGRGCLVPPGLRAGHRVWLLDPCQALLELREAGAGEVPGEDQNQQGTERIQALAWLSSQGVQVQLGFPVWFSVVSHGAAAVARSAAGCWSCHCCWKAVSVPYLPRPREHQHGIHVPPNTGSLGTEPRFMACPTHRPQSNQQQNVGAFTEK